MASIFSFARRKPNPRKVVTGTSYTATGIGPPPSGVDNELGSGTISPIQEVVPELSTPFQRTRTYGRMLTDAAVDVSMRSAKTPILGAEFFVEPFSDDPLDLEIAEFIWANLAEGMSAPFLNSLEDILRMFEDGYSVVEKVYERREWAPRKIRSAANTKQFVMLKKLGPRPASTIKEIQYDNNGGPVMVIQNAIQKDKSVKEKKIPIAKAVIFTFGRVGGDLTGKSLLRTAYSHWYYKTHMYKIDAIQKERHSLGIPKGKMLAGAKPSDKIVMRNLLRNLRTNEESFIIEPANAEISLMVPEHAGTLPDPLGSAAHHNGMILMNVLSQFIALGTEGGGRATAATQSDLFMKSLKYIANQIAQQINMYVIPELVVWNYPTRNFPQLQVRNIGETKDLQQLSAALANLFSQQAITPDADTENYIRRLFDLPRKSASSASSVSTTPTASNGSGNGKGGIKPNAITTGYLGKHPNAAQ